jgi:hypothetical protein
MSDVETADEEVTFWRGFIEWWAREKDEPVPPRAWEALACAEDTRANRERVQSDVKTSSQNEPATAADFATSDWATHKKRRGTRR